MNNPEPMSMPASFKESIIEETTDFKVATELGFLRACFESLVYVSPEGIPRLQAQIANSLSKLAACALLETVTHSSKLTPLSSVEVEAISAGFKGSLSQLVRDAAAAQRIKADFQLSKIG
jgi:hypothetical protein